MKSTLNSQYFEKKRSSIIEIIDREPGSYEI